MKVVIRRNSSSSFGSCYRCSGLSVVGWMWWFLVCWCIIGCSKDFFEKKSSKGVYAHSMTSFLTFNKNNNKNNKEKEKEKNRVLYPPNNILVHDVEEYPYSFEGRLWFRPSLVRVGKNTMTSTSSIFPEQRIGDDPVVQCVSLFGWSIGGVVALEYDDSPVGPYREYVTMGSIVRTSSSIGQWGSNLYVSTKQAEKVCQQLWNVPAQYANIQFTDDDNLHSTLTITQPPSSTNHKNKNKNKNNIQVNGWSQTQICKNNKNQKIRGGPISLPVVWTPSIKALWAPFFWFNNNNNDDSQRLPWHQLRLSAGAIRIVWCPQQQPQKTLGIPIPFGLAVDNVLIEISPQKGTL